MISNYSLRLLQLINVNANQGLSAQLKRITRKGSLGWNIMLLGGGTAVGQGLSILATPLLTRLFTPSDFGVLGAFVSVVSVCITVIAWKYEQAVPLPRERDVATSLLALSLLVSLLMICLIGILSGWFANGAFGWLEKTGLVPYLWTMPFALTGAGLFQVFNSWAIREKAYVEMAGIRVGQSLAIICAQLLGSLIWIGPLGLLLGDVVGRCLGTGAFASLLWRRSKIDLGQTSLPAMAAAARRYWRFPALSMGASLVSEAALILPTLLFAAFYTTEAAGWFALALRIVGAPSLFVGQAVGQVYWAEASERARNNPAALRSLFLLMVNKLLLLFALPMAVLAFVGPEFFALAFGENWREAGELVRYLAVPFLVRTAAVPVSGTLIILERQDWQVSWDLCRAIFVLGGLVLAYRLEWSVQDAVKLYAVTMAVSYVSAIFLSAAAINRRIKVHESTTTRKVI